MDLNQIQSLIKFVSKSGVSEVELETKDFKINIKATKSDEGTTQMVAVQPQGYMQQQPAPAPPPAAPEPTAKETADAASAAAAKEEADKYVTIKSPMIGTFYRSANPESDAFVNVGDDISKGKVICIIEAMKLFNEIEAEISGKIVKVLVDDATPIEYDQPLFLVDPS
ncbi:MAG: acetyl-CoA carboxylase biotin carboxyl carrier protein [Salibacteraceae bacterium]